MYLLYGPGKVPNLYWYCHSCLFGLPVLSANIPCVPIVHCKLPKVITCTTNKSKMVLTSRFVVVTNIFHWWEHYFLKVLPKFLACITNRFYWLQCYFYWYNQCFVWCMNAIKSLVIPIQFYW